MKESKAHHNSELAWQGAGEGGELGEEQREQRQVLQTFIPRGWSVFQEIKNKLLSQDRLKKMVFVP
jgi:hypothetical protein